MDYLNIAKAKFPLDDPRLKDFVAAIGAVKPVAESSFVWRLVTGAPGEPVPTAYGDDHYAWSIFPSGSPWKPCRPS